MAVSLQSVPSLLQLRVQSPVCSLTCVLVMSSPRRVRDVILRCTFRQLRLRFTAGCELIE